jgi:YYY domain-containing protein
VLTVVVWWLWIQVMGLAALPMAYRLFRWLPDRGYAFARPLGLLLTSYVLWLGGSLGLLRNSVGGALFSLFIVAVASVVVYYRGRPSASLASADAPLAGPPGQAGAGGTGTTGGSTERKADTPGLLAWLRAHGRLVLIIELLFAGALALWAVMRAYSPDLTTAGGEKFMEIMYLNSIGRSEYFPPPDAWLSGYAISYYYFGYVMIATLTRLSGLPAHLTFNVGLALLFALTCTGAFSVIYNLVRNAEKERDRATRFLGKPAAWGFLGVILVAVLGNLEGFLEVLYSARLLPQGFWRWLDIKDINLPFSPDQAPSLVPTRYIWWWRASRVIHDLDPLGNSMGIQPIDEFPGFSFLLGDMHPHVLALPFVLLALAIALNELRKGGKRTDEPSPAQTWWGQWLAPAKRLPLLVPLCLGALGFLNTWDFPIYWLLFVAAYGVGRWGRYGQANREFLRDVGVTGAVAAILGFLLYLPFYVGFRSQAGGLMPTIYVGTRFRHYFVMFGPFLVAIAGLLTVLSLRLRRGLLRGWAGWTAAFILLPLGLMVLIVFVLVLTPQGLELLEGIRHIPAVYEIVGDEPWVPLLGRLLLVKLRTWIMPLVVAAMAAFGVVWLHRSLAPHRSLLPGGEKDNIPFSPQRRKVSSLQESLRFALICAVVGLLLTLSVEFFYLIDIFRVRMNTIFKFYFQGWVLMAVASAFAVYWLSTMKSPQQRWLRRLFLVGFWLLFAMGMVYPVLGNVSRAGSFAHSPTLDGTAYLAERQPDDYAAVGWLNEHVNGTSVILEAPGKGGSSYVYEGRISALTGLPTLLGWAGHENQWRGSYEIQSAREPDIETIYNTLDPQAALALLDKHDITYVYVGPLERSKYDLRALEKFLRFMDVVYQEDGVTIYKARKQLNEQTG